MFFLYTYYNLNHNIPIWKSCADAVVVVVHVVVVHIPGIVPVQGIVSIVRRGGE